MTSVPVIFGPTAAGKSQLSVEIAKQLRGEIISADSMQVYRGMDIGTAKFSLAEQAGIPHHLLDIRNPDEAWTVSDFVNETNRLILEIEKRKHCPIISGGTGLYLFALIEGFSFPGFPADKELRDKLEKVPLNELYSRLRESDPASAARIHPHDKKRIIRTLEVYELTGRPVPVSNKSTPEINWDLIGINLPREILYDRINKRVDTMIKKGLVEEVEQLLKKGYAKELPAFQALGYKEAIKYLEGAYGFEEMIYELKKRTRHFARRQLTWFRRFKKVKWFEPPFDIREFIDYINSYDSHSKARN